MSDSSQTFLSRLPFGEELRGRLAGASRAFVVGMGPSLGKLDLGVLGDEIVFGVNHAAAANIRHDLLFLADDRRLGPSLRAGGVPVVSIDACVDAAPGFFSDIEHFSEIHAKSYAMKSPDILEIDSLAAGLGTVYWTGSVITDLVLPFAVECEISELVCLGLDGLDGSFPLTHAWGTDVLTLKLEREASSTAPQSLAPPALIAHLQEKAVALAELRGTRMLNATPGGTFESCRRVAAAEMVEGIWRDDDLSGVVSGSFLAIGSSVFLLSTGTGLPGRLRLDLVFEAGEGVNDCLDGREFIAEPGFVGGATIALRGPGAASYLTTRFGYDRYVERAVTESFSTALSSFPSGLDREAAARLASEFDSLRRSEMTRRATGEKIRAAYLEGSNA